MNAARRKQFEEDLARIIRRAGRLRAAMSGDADVVAVKVKKCVVPEHTRGSHTRYVIQKRSKQS